jgi:hypothetical protein
MNQKTALLLCSTAALIAFNGAGQAAPASPSPATVTPAQSYADLLAPIPNAVEMLKADDAARAASPRARVQLAQYHHHHHHHHHHHNGDFPGAIIGGIIGGALAPPPRYYYRHCYWTWGRPYWNGWRWVHPRERVCD